MTIRQSQSMFLLPFLKMWFFAFASYKEGTNLPEEVNEMGGIKDFRNLVVGRIINAWNSYYY